MTETGKCSIVQVGGFRPSKDPSATNFGLRPLGTAGEEWPSSKGKPLMFICQLNLTTAPFVPELLRDVALLTFFGDTGDWRLRAYPSLAGLIPMTPPAAAPALKRGFECRWQLADEDADQTKIGGIASTIQSEPWWEYREHPSNPQYCLQIDSEEKVGLAWGDAGMVYLARGTAEGCRDEWFLDWQCY